MSGYGGGYAVEPGRPYPVNTLDGPTIAKASDIERRIHRLHGLMDRLGEIEASLEVTASRVYGGFPQDPTSAAPPQVPGALGAMDGAMDAMSGRLDRITKLAQLLGAL